MKVYIILLLNTSNFKLLGSAASNLSLGEDPILRHWQTFKDHDQQENNAITKTSMIFKPRLNWRYLPKKVISHLTGINISNSYKIIYSNNSIIFPYDIEIGRNVSKKMKMDVGYVSMLHGTTELMPNLDSGEKRVNLTITLRGKVTDGSPKGIVKGSSSTIKSIMTRAIANDIFNVIKSNGDGDSASGTSGVNTDPSESGLDENAPENRSLLLAKFLIGKMLHKYHHHHHNHHPPPSHMTVEHPLILPRPMSFLRPPVHVPLARPSPVPQPIVYVPVPIPISVCKFPNCIKSTRRSEKVPHPPTKDKEVLPNMPPNPPLPRPKPRPKPNRRPQQSNLPFPTDTQTYAPYPSYPPYPPYPHTYAPYPSYPPYPPYPPTETYAPYEPYPSYPDNTNTYAPYLPYPSYPPYSDTYAPYPSYPPYSDTYAPYPPYPPYPTYPPYPHTYAPYPSYPPYPPYPTYPPNTYTYATYAPYPSNTHTYAPYEPYPTYAPYPSSSVTYPSYPSPTAPISLVDTLESPETNTPTPEDYKNNENPYYELLLK